MLSAAFATAPRPLVTAQTETSGMALNLVRFRQAETFVDGAVSLPSLSAGERMFIHPLTVRKLGRLLCLWQETRRGLK